MLKMLRRLIGEDVDLAWEPGADLWEVHIDPGQVDQILANLCVNARDAIESTGKVTIETENVTIDAAYCAKHEGFKPGDFTMLAVSDDGCGMDRETLDHIFEPFYTTKDIGEGTGLGLATVYGIAKQNEGFVNVYSEPGKGTTFRIYLPRFEGGERTRADRQDQAETIGGNETILLVEDEKSIRLTMRLFLEKLGYMVLAAEKPEKARTLLSSHAGTIDLLITDVVMPGMSGRELAESLTADHPDMRVLYMSGYTANVIAHRGVLEDGVDFLSKPITQAQLARKVREILDRT
jgi:CheY-like chemotaxis protein